jgi:hypothetical protein
MNKTIDLGDVNLERLFESGVINMPMREKKITCISIKVDIFDREKVFEKIVLSMLNDGRTVDELKAIIIATKSNN